MLIEKTDWSIHCISDICITANLANKSIKTRRDSLFTCMTIIDTDSCITLITVYSNDKDTSHY